MHIMIPHRAIFNKREKKGTRIVQKGYICYNIVGKKTFLAQRVQNKMAKKGREIKVHFTFDMNMEYLSIVSRYL